LAVELGLDCQGSLIEPPGLSVSSVSGLDNHVPVVDQIKVSVVIHFGNDVEWSFNVQTEVFVELTLGWFSWIFISVDDIPLLVESLMFVPHNDVSVFSINIS
jgi:hypothetical protein